jgi:hypothetical protein
MISVGKVVKKSDKHYTYWWQCKMVQLLWDTIQLNLELQIEPAILLLGVDTHWCPGQDLTQGMSSKILIK